MRSPKVPARRDTPGYTAATRGQSDPRAYAGNQPWPTSSGPTPK